MQFSTAAVATIIGAMAFASAAAASAGEQVVKFGFIAPLTGPLAVSGKDIENGAQMAIEDLNTRAISIGGKRVRFELLAEDDANEPKQATAAAQKLVDANVNGVVGPANSGTAIPASKIFFDAGIPQLSPLATNPQYTLHGYKTAFRLCANDDQLGGALGRYAVQALKLRKIAVIDDATAYGQGLAVQFTKAAKVAAPATAIVATEHTTDQATDFNAILTRIKASNPDVIFLGGMYSTGAPMLRQMKALGMPLKLMGGDGLCSSEQLVSLAGDALTDGQVICADNGGVGDARAKAVADWNAAFHKRFGANQGYAARGYDAVMTLAQAIQQAGSAEPAKYLPVLAHIKYQGITADIEFDQHGDMKDAVMTMYTFKHGKREPIIVVH